MFAPLRRLSLRKSKKKLDDDAKSVTSAPGAIVSDAKATPVAPVSEVKATPADPVVDVAAAATTAVDAADTAVRATSAALAASPRVSSPGRIPGVSTGQPTGGTTANPASSVVLEALTTMTFGPRNAFPLYVPVADLHNATDNGLNKMKSRALSRLRRRVYVEAAANSRSDSLFYVPLPDVASIHAAEHAGKPAPVGFAAVPPSVDTRHLVLASDDFEVALVGMHTVPQDVGFEAGSELLLYSVRDLQCANTRRADHPARKPDREAAKAAPGGAAPEQGPNGGPDGTEPGTRSERDGASNGRGSVTFSRRGRGKGDSSGDESGSEGAKRVKPSAHLNENDDAKIHFDPLIDGHNQGSSPNTYVNVPGRKGLLLQHRGAVDSHIDTVEARFTVVEVDSVTPAQRRGVKKAGEVLTGTVGAVPFGKFVTPALGGFGSLANSALDRFEVPDHVISRDVMFRLLRDLPDDDTNPARGKRRPLYADNYLRYGYYFFLAQKVDAKLYAQNDTSSQTVPLLLRRLGRRGRDNRLGEREFFPLTGVNYVVMKVTPGCLNGRTDRTARQQEHDRERLEEILNMKKAMDLLRGPR